MYTVDKIFIVFSFVFFSYMVSIIGSVDILSIGTFQMFSSLCRIQPILGSCIVEASDRTTDLLGSQTHKLRYRSEHTHKIGSSCKVRDIVQLP